MRLTEADIVGFLVFSHSVSHMFSSLKGSDFQQVRLNNPESWRPHIRKDIHTNNTATSLILAYCNIFSCNVEACSAVSCKSADISVTYQHCGIYPGGVHDLDCFGKYGSLSKKTCVWKPGNHVSEKRYILIIQQEDRKYCRAHTNITGISKEVTLYEKYNMTVQVFENSDSANCTKAVFKGSPKSLLRCGPPYNVSFSRHSGRLVVNVRWQQADTKAIKNYSVRYKAMGSLLWSESPVYSENSETCTVESLNTSLAYTVQMQCARNEHCSQCVWSEAYNVPAELTTRPVIDEIQEVDIDERRGRRMLILTWKFSAKELHDGYSVTVGKASGEAPCERIDTIWPEIRLILSYSAYHLQISAVNNASTSPALTHTLPQREDRQSVSQTGVSCICLCMSAGKLNVTVHSNTYFTIHWHDNLINNYVCYCVEWMKKRHKAAYMSFYENENNFKTLSPLPEPLEPYKRYSITLHTRPNNDSCNMKHINNSESTYGTAQFYFIEGFPVSAPTNITSYNVTLNSLVLQWSSIPEEDVRGFLLGYTIHLMEYHHMWTGTEDNITVDPVLNTYELTDLKCGAAYEVQISGFTQTGEGVRSKASLVTTNQCQEYSNVSGVITLLAVVTAVLAFGLPAVRRVKWILWPNVPNPKNSSAMQKIDRTCELEQLESIYTLKVAEWDTNSLQIVEQEVNTTRSSPSMPPLLHDSEGEEDSAQIMCDWTQGDTEDATGDILPPPIHEQTFTDTQQQPPLVLASGYTTMEMFRQVTPQEAPAERATQDSKSVETDPTVVKSGLDYVRQISTSSIVDNKDTT